LNKPVTLNTALDYRANGLLSDYIGSDLFSIIFFFYHLRWKKIHYYYCLGDICTVC